MLHFAALLAISLCAEPPAENKPAAGTDAAKPTVDLIKLEADVKKALERLETIEKGLGAIENRNRTLVGDLGVEIQRSLNDINKKLSDIRFDLDGVKMARGSISEKRTEPTPVVPLTTATVMLVNTRMDMPMETLVNGTTYVVEASRNRTISVPAGALQVRVMATDAVVRERRLDTGAMHVVTLR